MFGIKKGVKICSLTPQAVLMIAIVNDYYKEMKIDCIITSCNDGKHIDKSFHRFGFAIDFRSNNIRKENQLNFWKGLKEVLGDNFQVIFEKDHFHIEYDPKIMVS